MVRYNRDSEVEDGLDDEFEREPDGDFDPDDDEFDELDASDELDDLTFDDDFDDDDADRDPFRDGEVEPVLLVWPREEYELVDQRWPEVIEPIGADNWEGYRRHHQALIVRWAKRGQPLSMVTGSADGFADWLSEQGTDPLTVDLVAMADAYGHHLAEQVGAVELPPAETDQCWCGSELSYRECCQRLSLP